MEFCDWLTRKRLELSAREGRRVPQKEVADRAGISRQYLGFLEAGVNPTTGRPPLIDRDLARRLAAALWVPEEEALRAAGFGENLSDDEAVLVRRYRQLDARQSAVVDQLLETFVPGVTFGVGSGARSAAPALAGMR
jgi:transcriptional regulator with XRE-family HTH domain